MCVFVCVCLRVCMCVCMHVYVCMCVCFSLLSSQPLYSLSTHISQLKNKNSSCAEIKEHMHMGDGAPDDAYEGHGAAAPGVHQNSHKPPKLPLKPH